MLTETVIVALITVTVPSLLGAIGFLGLALWRWWKKRRAEQQTSEKAVDALERAIAKQGDQIASLNELVRRMEAERDRMDAIISRQDRRMERKDARIAHLETLVDRRGVRP